MIITAGPTETAEAVSISAIATFSPSPTATSSGIVLPIVGLPALDSQTSATTPERCKYRAALGISSPTAGGLLCARRGQHRLVLLSGQPTGLYLYIVPCLWGHIVRDGALCSEHDMGFSCQPRQLFREARD